MEDFDIWCRGPRLFAHFHQLRLAVAGFAIHLVDLKLVRLLDREVQWVPKRRGPGLLLEINIGVVAHHGLKFREVDVAVAEPRTLPPPSLWQ